MRSVALLACLLPATAAAQTVEGVLGATSDAWDVAVTPTETLVATSGGLVVVSPLTSHPSLHPAPTLHATPTPPLDPTTSRILGVADGLPGGRCRSVTVVDGDVWVGTLEGAARLDASLHVVERVDVRRVSRAARLAGTTWLGSFGDGLYRLTPNGPEHVSLGASGARDRVADLRVVGDELWVATAGAGVVRVSADGHVAGRITSAQGLPDDVVTSFADGGSGTTLVGTMSGATVVRGAHVLGPPSSSPLARSLAVLTTSLPIHDVRALAFDRARNLWVATWGSGVWRVRAGVASRVGSTALHARRVVADGDGVVVAAEDGTFRLGATPSPLVAGGLPSGDVTCLASAFGALWAGTFTHGVARVAADATRADAQPAITSRFGVDARVNDLAVTRDASGETLWIATDRGLYATDGRSYWPVEAPQAPPRGHVLALVTAANGDLWAASSHEVARLHDGHWHSFVGTPGVPLVSIDALALACDGTVWLGTLHGLVALDPTSGALTAHTVASGALPVDWVTALVARGDSVIAGTYHGGLVELRADGTTRTVHEGERGLASGWVNPHALADIGGRLYVGTLDRGLYVGDLDHGFVRLGAREGLPSDDVTSFHALSPDTILVTTRAGIARIAPRTDMARGRVAAR